MVDKNKIFERVEDRKRKRGEGSNGSAPSAANDELASKKRQFRQVKTIGVDHFGVNAGIDKRLIKQLLNRDHTEAE